MAARSRVLTTAAALAALAALTAACTSTPQPIPGRPTAASAPPAMPPPEPAPGRVAGVPIPEGRIAAAVDRLDALAADARVSAGAQGLAVAVVHGGKVVFQRGYGTAPRAAAPAGAAPTAPAPTPRAGIPVDENTVFPLGALSTPVAATVVATRLSGGRSWSTPVRELMPEFAVADPYVSAHATLGDLFSGTLGLPSHAGGRAARLGMDRQMILDRLPALPLEEFRAEARPGDLGPTVVGEAVARAAGTDWATLSERSLFDRLGMDSTGFRSADYAASGAVPGGTDRAWADAVAPARGLGSSVHDMATWMKTVLAGGTHHGAQVIPAEPLAAALSPQAVPVRTGTTPVDTRGVSRGFGFDVTDSPAGRVVITAGGQADAGGGADAALTLIPSADLGIVTLATPAPASGADGAAPAPQTGSAARVLNAEFSDLAQFGEVQRDWTGWYAEATGDAGSAGGPAVSPTAPPAAPPAPLPQYDGVYANPYFGAATVRTTNDTLVLAVGAAPRSFRLTRIRGDLFSVAPLDPRDRAAASFLRGSPDATASFDGNTLTLSFLGQAGPFRR